jgi:predicted Ser/Thr protein kinase
MPQVPLDLPKLAERIREIAQTYRPGMAIFEDIEDNEESGSLFNTLSGFLRRIVLNLSAQDPIYWKAAGIRMESPEDFADCLGKIKQDAEMLGKGFYGTVYKVPTNSCLKNIPKKVTHVGVKMEILKPDYDVNQTPARLKEVTEIARQAAEIKVGPELYDFFVTVAKDGTVQIIKIFQIIEGKSWADTEWKTSAKKHAALEKLNIAIHKMNHIGIIHHDLHSGNVMVSKSGEVYIIDYDLARKVDNEESGLISEFNHEFGNPWEPKGAASTKGLKYIYNKLVEEGSIKIAESENATKNVSISVKAKNNRTKKAKNA